MAEPKVLEVLVPAGEASLPGTLCLPADATGLVLFAHGSGSGRASPRNRFVAGRLQKSRLATLLFDLLEPGEAEDRAFVFDIALLERRLAAGVAWARTQAALRPLPMGLFGASTGAAAALRVAAMDARIAAVVSRGGRPDLAMDVLPRVHAPTLLIVGSLDHAVLEWNEAALRALAGTKELRVVRGATHLFEEPGCLEEVARHAAAWFVDHLSPHVTEGAGHVS